MSSRKEREERAFEALIVSQLCQECDPDKVKPENLPKLTDKEKAALDALGPDLVDRLWNQGKQSRPVAPGTTEQPVTGRFVMNRAETISEETAKELERRRAEIRERLKKQREEKKDG